MEWGIDLGSEHERYLAEKADICFRREGSWEVYKKPVILYNYPKVRLSSCDWACCLLPVP